MASNNNRSANQSPLHTLQSGIDTATNATQNVVQSTGDAAKDLVNLTQKATRNMMNRVTTQNND